MSSIKNKDIYIANCFFKSTPLIIHKGNKKIIYVQGSEYYKFEVGAILELPNVDSISIQLRDRKARLLFSFLPLETPFILIENINVGLSYTDIFKIKYLSKLELFDKLYSAEE
jgi:hypothetical protein